MGNKLFSEIDYRNDLLSSFTFEKGKDIPDRLIYDTNLALVAVVFITIGLEKTISFILNLLKMDTPLIELYLENDAKSVAMEVAQLFYKNTPTYKKLRESGADNEKVFESAIIINGQAFGTASGKSIKESEENAAKVALHSPKLRSMLNTWFQRKLSSIQIKKIVLNDLPINRHIQLTPLAKQLGISTDDDYKLLNKALTHPSWCNDRKLPTELSLNNITTPGINLFDIYSYHLVFLTPQIPNSKIEIAKTCLYKQLYQVFDSLKFNNYISLGNAGVLISERIKNEFVTPTLYVIYKTNGFKAVKSLLDSCIGGNIQKLIDNEEVLKENSKNRLQNMLQKETRDTPKDLYSIIETSGPVHKRVYKVEASFNGFKLGVGIGKSLVEAEESAAKAAIIELAKNYNKVFSSQK